MEVTNDIRIDLRLEPGTVSETVGERGCCDADVQRMPRWEARSATRKLTSYHCKDANWQGHVLPGVDRTPGGGFRLDHFGARPEDNNYLVVNGRQRPLLRDVCIE